MAASRGLPLFQLLEQERGKDDSHGFPGKRRLRTGLEQTSDACDKVERVNRLADYLEVVASLPRLFEKIRGARLPGKEHDPAPRLPFLDPDGEVYPGKLRHSDVGKQEVDGLGAGAIPGLERIGKGG